MARPRRLRRRRRSRLATAAAKVPGADDRSLHLGVSRAGFDTSGLDIELGPEDLIAAWRRPM
ncbi:MAG: hypothetical protein H0V93_16425 [Euzebyales bacterium]|nr:hypothetical protein [Euzebyales bacterium]